VDASEFHSEVVRLGLYRYAVSITVGIASEAEMKEIYSVAKKCLNEGI
jgi:hypothetical protein